MICRSSSLFRLAPVTHCAAPIAVSHRCFSSTSPENPRQLSVTLRPSTKLGSRKSRVIRKAGYIPGVLYGTDDDGNVMKQTIMANVKDVRKEVNSLKHSLENTIYNLEVVDEVTKYSSHHIVVPRQLQCDAVTDELQSVNFLAYTPSKRLRIPIEYTNVDLSPDLKRGCFLVRVNGFLECLCNNEVPRALMVDVQNVRKGDVIRLRDIQLPPGVRPSPSVSLDFVACVVRAGRGS